MYLFLVGGCRASWWGSQGYKSVRREVTSSDRQEAGGHVLRQEAGRGDPGAQLTALYSV